MTPEQEEAGYAALAADYQAEDAERRRIARRRTPPESWRDDWDSSEDRAAWDDDGVRAALGEAQMRTQPMQDEVTITYDPDACAAYVYLGLGPRTSARTQELSDAVNVDYDASGHVIGIELLGVSRPATPVVAGATPRVAVPVKRT